MRWLWLLRGGNSAYNTLAATATLQFGGAFPSFSHLLSIFLLLLLLLLFLSLLPPPLFLQQYFLPLIVAAFYLRVISCSSKT